MRYFPNIERSIDTSGICLLDYEDFKVVCIGAKDSSASLLNSIQGEDGTIEIPDSLGSFGSYKIKKQVGTMKATTKMRTNQDSTTNL